MIEGVDIGSAEGVARLPAQLDVGVKIDNLWLNAGIGIGIEDSLEVRHVAGWPGGIGTWLREWKRWLVTPWLFYFLSWTDHVLQDLDFDGVRTSFEVNAMGPLRCVQALLPSLKKGTKVIAIGSIV